MQDIIDYIRQLRIDFVLYWDHNNPLRLSKEQKLGKIALVAIQELIKIQHIKKWW